MTEEVRVRFAPSPTGYLHIGGARTALFNWLFARQTKGKFILRLEDTDEARNTEAAKRTIYEGLRWLELEPDEGPEQGGPFSPYAQSERMPIYRAAIDELKRTGGAYPCFCSKERLAELRKSQEAARQTLRYDRRCRALDRAEIERELAKGTAPTWRLKVPDGETVLDDLIRGRIVVNHADVEDIILVRGDGTPIYNLAVVIDDHSMRITHVLRGEDHLTNCFKQIILFRAFGWPVPRYGHLPLILAPAGRGSSKRKHPEAAVEHYQAKDYDKEALINWLALIGWSFDDKTEIMSRAELVERFSVERINRSGARLNLEKLAAMSGQYIRKTPLDQVIARLTPHLVRAGFVASPPTPAETETIRRIAAAEHERLRYYAEIVDLAKWAFVPELAMDEKAEKNLVKSKDVPSLLRAYAASLPEVLPAPGELEQLARAFCEVSRVGFSTLVHPVRAALTGRTAGPPLFDCLGILGRSRAAERLLHAADRAERLLGSA